MENTILTKIGCPSNFVNMFKELHKKTKACVTFNGQSSSETAIDNGVKQGDTPALTLFSILFSVLLTHTFKDCVQKLCSHVPLVNLILNLTSQ